jgi:hypothetical protein
MVSSRLREDVTRTRGVLASLALALALVEVLLVDKTTRWYS